MDLPTQQAPGGMSALPNQAPAKLLHAHISAPGLPQLSVCGRETLVGQEQARSVCAMARSPWLGRGRAPFRTGPREGRGVSASVSAAVGPKA